MRNYKNNNQQRGHSAVIKYFHCLFLILPVSMPASAFQALDDGELAAVSGRDGISVIVDTGTAGMSADVIQATLDAGTANEATLSASFVTATGVGLDGTVAGAGRASVGMILDAGADADGVPLMSLGLDVPDRMRLRTEALTLAADPHTPIGAGNRSYGTWAADFTARAQLVNNGLFSMTYDKAYLLGEVNNADIFYRQGPDTNAWMAMHDLNLYWEIEEGIVGLDGGIVQRTGSPWRVGDAQRPIYGEVGYTAPVRSDLLHIALDFEYIFGRKNGAEEFQITPDARGLMHFGWLGSVKDAEIKWMPGGVWQGETPGPYGNELDPYGANAVTSGGIRLSSQWDYVSRDEAIAVLGDPEREFRWRLGETADVGSSDKSRINFELGDWVMWGTRTARKPAPHYFPLIAIDVIGGAGQGPGGLCWGHGSKLSSAACGGASGAQFMNIQPGWIGNTYGSIQHSGDAGAIALLVRDGQLQTYSRIVRLLERDASGNVTQREFNWGLIYSLANVDANIYLYPGGNDDSENYGVIADLLVMSQTLDADDPSKQGFNWDHGTHLMIADTEAEMGLGFISSSFVVAGNDTRIWVKNKEGNDYYSGGLDFFSPEARFNYRATFGGGLLPGHPLYDPLSTTQPQTVRGALIDLNLEGLVNLRFSPSDPNEANNPDGARNFLGYSGALRLGTNPGTGVIGGSTLRQCGGESCGSYLSLAEPNKPEVDFRLAQVSGDVAFTNGRVDIVGTGERSGSPEPKMVLANTIEIGTAAQATLQGILDTTNVAYGAPQQLRIDKVMLGDANLGRIIIPAARIHSSITLEPQSAAY